MAKTILIIDDDIKLCQLLRDYLQQFGYQVEAINHPQEGLRWLKNNCPDLIILDIMLPDLDGFQVLKKLREKDQIPVIMLTARGEVADRIVGLELGADDYLPKPFEPRELVARIQTVLRRSIASSTTDTIKIDNLMVDKRKHQAFLDESNLELTTMEYELLILFLQHHQMVLNRDQILENIRGLEWDPENRSVDVLVSRLRQKLQDDPKKPKFIKTVWGTGYMFIGVLDE